MNEFEVLATNGKMERRILWLRTSKNGIQAGIHQEGKNHHYTYHVDGNLWETFNGRKRKIGSFQPLDGFKEYVLIVAWGFTRDSVNYRKPHTFERQDTKRGYVDVSDIFKENLNAGCGFYLVEPKRDDLVNEILSTLDVAKSHLIRETSPWILITVHKSKGVRASSFVKVYPPIREN